VIKLTKHESADRVEVRIEGRLDIEAIRSLRAITEATPPSNLTLDLAGLTSVDPCGGTFLVGLRKSGVRLLGGSLYINHLLLET
jgi:anti-anti-sigma regulatory factor